MLGGLRWRSGRLGAPTSVWRLAMADIAVFGTAVADVVLRVAALPRSGEQIRAEPLGWRLGGSSANIACGLAAAGHDVELIGPVGTDSMADELLAELERRGVHTRGCIRMSGASARALILIDAKGERTILILGVDPWPEPLPLRDLRHASGVACVYVENYGLFPTTIADRFPEALLVATPPAAGRSTWPADIIVGSERQFQANGLMGPYESARAVAGGRLKVVVVTRGARGADAYGPHGCYHVATRTARQVDATGAGDAFAAGLIAALLAEHGIQDAMERATAQGAAAVEVLQSIPPDWVESIDRA
jgi:sugar/nucleoside kinase (ribokinase family)